MDSFTITLPSNVVSKDGNKNRISSYRTSLAQRIDLDGDWLVGLYEISYSKSWYNIPWNESIYLIDYTGKHIGVAAFEPGFYTDGESLQAAIQCTIVTKSVLFSSEFLITQVNEVTPKSNSREDKVGLGSETIFFPKLIFD